MIEKLSMSTVNRGRAWRPAQFSTKESIVADGDSISWSFESLHPYLENPAGDGNVVEFFCNAVYDLASLC